MLQIEPIFNVKISQRDASLLALMIHETIHVRPVSDAILTDKDFARLETMKKSFEDMASQ